MPFHSLARATVRPTLALALSLPGLAASALQTPQYALTLYNTQDAQPLFSGPVDFEPPPGYAIVHERRTTEIGSGRGTLTLNGFPRYMDVGALTIALERGRVLSQRFDAEPLRSERILERSIGRQVTVEQTLGGQLSSLTGELLSASLPLALRLQDGSIVSINDYSRIRLDSPAAGFSALPQLRLGVEALQAGRQTIALTYPTAGLAWRAEYTAQLKSGRDCRLDFTGFAQIVNRSGYGFSGAQVKLIAGEPQRDRSTTSLLERADAGHSGAASAAEAIGDAYQYRLEIPIDMPDGSSQQVALVPEQRGIRCAKELLYVGQPLRAQPHRVPITERDFGQGGGRRVHSILSFLLDEKLPIPAGRVRVLTEDPQDGSLAFMGEQQISHTPAGQTLDIAMGNAFDLKGEREVTDFKFDPGGLGVSEVITVRLRNGGESSTRVRVREHLYRWTQWTIAEHSQPFDKRNGDTIEFMIDVPAKADTSLSYRVNYRWTERFE